MSSRDAEGYLREDPFGWRGPPGFGPTPDLALGDNVLAARGVLPNDEMAPPSRPMAPRSSLRASAAD